MDLEGDIKWKHIESTSKEIAYYCHKITGQQRWTNKNCYCPKTKDPLQPTLPCCYKKHFPSSIAKGLTEDSHAKRRTCFPNDLSTEKLYSLSDIVNEVQKSFLVRRPKSYIYKGSGKRKRTRRKNNKTLGFKNDRNSSKGPTSDVNITLDSKRDIIGTKDSGNRVDSEVTMPGNDVNTNQDTKNEAIVNESTKNDAATKDFDNDVGHSKYPQHDFSTTKKPNHDVIATKVPKHDVSTAKETKTGVILNVEHVDSSKTEEKLPSNKRILKRKIDVSDVSGYKARLRVRRNKIQVAYRRKYRRKNVFKSAESGQAPHDANDSSSKEENLESVEKQLRESCDQIEQSIIEIVQCTSDYPVEVDYFCSDLGARSLRSEGIGKQSLEASPKSRRAKNNPDNIPNAVVRPRFVNEEFIQMNKPFCALTKTGKKEFRKSKIAVSQRNHLKRTSPDVSRNSSSKRQTVKQPNSNSDLDSFDFVPLITRSSSLLTSEATKTQTRSPKTEQLNQEYSERVLNISPSRDQSKRLLHTIVKRLKDNKRADVAMPLTSTVSKGRWSTILSKEAKKIKNSSNTKGVSTSGDTSNPGQGGQHTPVSPNNNGNNSSESVSPFGLIKNTFSLADNPKAASVKPVSMTGPSSTRLSKTLGTNSAKPVKKEKVDRGVGTHDTTSQGMKYHMAKLAGSVTEVPASYVDLSWRIVTSNDGHSASLHNFFKLVPVVISRGPSGIIDEQEPMSFLGVPIYGGPQVIAKILNTSIAEKCNEIFKVRCESTVNTGNICIKKMTLSFVWENGVVRVESDLMKAGGLSGEDIKPRSPVWIDISNKVSMVLPKPLRLPVAGNVIYLGDFNVKSSFVEFVVTHSVMVTKSPRPSLTIPSGTPMNSSSTACQTIRCRSPGEARNDVKTVKAVPVSKKFHQEDEKMFRKCVFCGKILKCRRDVKLHRKLHVSFLGTKCSECKRRFNNGGRLSVHIVTHKCHWHHVCKKCKKIFRTPKFLTTEDLAKDYYKMCLSCRRKELKCKKCTERRMTFEELDAHFKKTHGLKCSICESYFLCMLDLSKHMRCQHKIESLPPSSHTSIRS